MKLVEMLRMQAAAFEAGAEALAAIGRADLEAEARRAASEARGAQAYCMRAARRYFDALAGLSEAEAAAFNRAVDEGGAGGAH